MNGHSTTTHSAMPTLGQIHLEQPVQEEVVEPDELYYDNHYGIYNAAMSRNVSWEYKTLTLTRVPGYGFGIAVSGGSDNPHFANGDPAIAISDVLKGGPAENKLSINDRIITANGIKLENVEYGTAVQVLRDSGPSVNLIIKRRIIAHHTKLALNKLTTTKIKHIQPIDYGVNLTLRLFIKESKNSQLVEGDEVISINGLDVAKLFDFRKGVNEGEGKLVLGVVKQQQTPPVTESNGVHHHNQQSYDSAAGNLYVQPPTRARGRNSEPVRPPLPDSPITPPPPPPPNQITLTPYKTPTPRFINFLKKASSPLGLKLVGGNNVGIFIGALQPSTPAANSGLIPGDQILRVNDTSFTSLPRSEAVSSLSTLPPDTLVSFIVKHVENYREILAQEKYHDFLYYRVLSGSDPPPGTLLLLIDTLPSPTTSTALIIPKHSTIPSPNKLTLPKSINLTPLRLIKVPWARPIVVVSLFTEHIYENLLKQRGRRKFAIVPEENLKLELHRIKDEMTHGLIIIKDNLIDLLNGWLGDYCPIIIIVQTEDKSLIKKCNNKGRLSNYGSLLRFNKSHTLHKTTPTSLERLESSLGSWVDARLSVSSADNLGEVVGRRIEEVLGRVGDVGWVSNNDCNTGEHQTPPTPTSPLEIPSYCIPPPYSIPSHPNTDYTPIPNTPLQNPPPIKKHSKNYEKKHSTYSPTQLKQPTTPLRLTHSPIDDLNPSLPSIPPPQIDRTKKPHPSSLINGKPIPPPKPKLVRSYDKPYMDDNRSGSGPDQGYYLNLPMNSKIVRDNLNNSAFAQFSKSSMPVMQSNTTSGTFSSTGGTLTQRNTKPGQIPIQVFIPEGAIPHGRSETIYFHVVDEEFLENSDFVNGNTSSTSQILSPLIKFGPENLRFLIPIEIRIPQYNRKSSTSNNAVLLNNGVGSWSRVNIQRGEEFNGEDVKIVSLTVQKF